MLRVSEDDLICDFAETYGIYDLWGWPLDLVATLACGLRDNSRIKMRLANSRTDLQTALLARLCDDTSFLAWSKTKDAQHNKHRPKSMVALLLEKEKPSNVMAFDDAEEWEQMRASILKRKEQENV